MINKAIIVGNLGRDPEIRHTNGGEVCNLSVATTRKWKNKSTDEWCEETEWHRVTVFGSSAKACGTYLSKGSQVYVEGRIKTSSYEDKDGVKRYSTEIIANTVQFLGGRGDGGGQSRGGGGQGQAGAQGGGGHHPGARGYGGGGGGENPPF